MSAVLAFSNILPLLLLIHHIIQQNQFFHSVSGKATLKSIIILTSFQKARK